ncbi:hypothetical protein Tco_1125540 [Tanacetum coccineum]|uniref:Uncharacterized protein n=1 Tax=Tanacetum coccineum TaxID=301880 RepID=A0ABQ5JB01_9ASTR
MEDTLGCGCGGNEVLVGELVVEELVVEELVVGELMVGELGGELDGELVAELVVGSVAMGDWRQEHARIFDPIVPMEPMVDPTFDLVDPSVAADPRFDPTPDPVRPAYPDISQWAGINIGPGQTELVGPTGDLHVGLAVEIVEGWLVLHTIGQAIGARMKATCFVEFFTFELLVDCPPLRLPVNPSLAKRAWCIWISAISCA